MFFGLCKSLKALVYLVGDTGLEDVAPTLEPLYGAVFSYEPNLLN